MISQTTNHFRNFLGRSSRLAAACTAMTCLMLTAEWPGSTASASMMTETTPGSGGSGTTSPLVPGVALPWASTIWNDAFGRNFKVNESALLLGDEVEPGVFEVHLVDHSLIEALGEVPVVGTYTEVFTAPFAEAQDQADSEEIQTSDGPTFASWFLSEGASAGTLESNNGWSEVLVSFTTELDLTVELGNDVVQFRALALFPMENQSSVDAAVDRVVGWTEPFADELFRGFPDPDSTYSICSNLVANNPDPSPGCDCGDTYSCCYVFLQQWIADTLSYQQAVSDCRTGRVGDTLTGCGVGAAVLGVIGGIATLPIGAVPGAVVGAVGGCVIGGVVGYVWSTSACKGAALDNKGFARQAAYAQFLLCLSANCGCP